MKHQQNAYLQILHRLPHNMLKVHGHENMSEFVLHQLCCQNGFNLSKAAYFVDSPSFDYLKGVAGYDYKEAYNGNNMWEQPEPFSNHMRSAPFNQKVRSCSGPSCKKNNAIDHTIIKNIADQVGMDTYDVCIWDMKHDNHGCLIYQACDYKPDEEHLLCGVSLLGFCPVF